MPYYNDFLVNKGKDLPYMSDDSGLATTPQKKLQPIPPPSKTWKHIGMDLICDFAESKDGYKPEMQRSGPNRGPD